MSKRRKLCNTIAVAFCIAVAVLIMTWLDPLTPAAPPGWKAIHVGMTRRAALSLAGAPQISGWPEKIIETWERRGLICKHRMCIYYDYDGGPEENARVDGVTEGTWLRGYGWLHPRSESR
jgi:hypothetical protein